MGQNSALSGWFVPAPYVLFEEIEGETVLLDYEQEFYFSLDSVGTRVWQLLIEEGDIAAVKSRMLAEFDVDEPTLNVDLHDLLERLRAARLVVARNRP